MFDFLKNVVFFQPAVLIGLFFITFLLNSLDLLLSWTVTFGALLIFYTLFLNLRVTSSA